MSARDSLNLLIAKLTKSLKEKDGYTSVIRYPKLLIKSLYDLSNMIGNDEIKSSTASQVSFLIMTKHKEQATGVKNKSVMLNTVIYGPPGVGKTMIATKLAKIWYALGYLEPDADTKTPTFVERTLGDAQGADNLLFLYVVIILITIIISLASTMWAFGSKMYEYIGLKWFLIILAVVLIIFGGLAIYFYYNWNSGNGNVSKGKKEDIVIKNDNGDQVIEVDVEDSEIIDILGKEDLCGQYVGWTAKKTKDILNKNRGKRVTFVDEVYNLVSHTNDFGEEALTVINKDMSEHPRGTCVIFAGYKEEIEKKVFPVQKGLVRRFMWYFDCRGYTPAEMFEIFKSQVAADGYKFEDNSAVKELFVSNADKFPNFGGDTEKLFHFTRLRHSDAYSSDKDVAFNVLKTEHVRNGIKDLAKNTIKVEDRAPINQNDYRRFLDMFGRGEPQYA